MRFVTLDGELRSDRTPHEKCVIGGVTYYFARMPEGDFFIHVSDNWKQGYGAGEVDFLMIDGTTKTVVGPWQRNGAYACGEAELIAKTLNRPEIAVQATRLVIGRNLWSYCAQPKIVVFEEKELLLGDWRQRMRKEWIGWECEVKKRRGSSFRDVGQILDELKMEQADNTTSNDIR